MKKKIVFIVFVILMIWGFFNKVYADTMIHLDIETASGSLYNQDISVAPCDSDNAGTMTITVYCAVLQSGVTSTSDWSWYGTDAFVNSVGGVANDYVNNIYWGWFYDLVYGDTAMSAHTLTEGENILLTFDINPLKLSVSDSDPTQNQDVDITLTQFGLDSSYNPVWSTATNGAVEINSNSFNVNSDGIYSTTMELMIPYVISGHKTGFVNSNSITLNPTRAISGGGGGGGGYIAPLGVPVDATPNLIMVEEKIEEKKKITFNKEKAFKYLISQQKEDGSFGEDIYTDWATLALASGNYQEQILKLVQYSVESRISGNLLTDYERHAMALMSLGLNPYRANENYIKKITDSFDGKQFGDIAQYNDDIFALIVLQNVGYSQYDKMILDDIHFILSAQNTDGSWDASVDITGAAIESLSNFSSIIEVRESLVKAKEFLKQNQKNDGGWGNVSSTAWVMQGILALGEKPEDWIKNKKTPFDYLTSNQDTDGGIKNEDVKSKIWETSYVLSALSEKSWNQLMKKFKNPETIVVTETSVENKKEVKQIEIKKVVKKVNIENITQQNVAIPIIAINTFAEEKKIEPMQKKSWINRFFGAIFGF